MFLVVCLAIISIYGSQLHSRSSGYMMYVAQVMAQNCCSFYFCVSVTSLPHQLPDPPGLSDFQSKLHLLWHADLSSLDYSALH